MKLCAVGMHNAIPGNDLKLTYFFYVLCSDKTRVFDQSECAQGPTYIIMDDKMSCQNNPNPFNALRSLIPQGNIIAVIIDSHSFELY